jgi:membrane-associated protein
VLLGYFFGNLPIVQNNFEFVVFGIIGLSLLPMVFEMVRATRKKQSGLPD